MCRTLSVPFNLVKFPLYNLKQYQWIGLFNLVNSKNLLVDGWLPLFGIVEKNRGWHHIWHFDFVVRALFIASCICVPLESSSEYQSDWYWIYCVRCMGMTCLTVPPRISTNRYGHLPSELLRRAYVLSFFFCYAISLVIGNERTYFEAIEQNFATVLTNEEIGKRS